MNRTIEKKGLVKQPMRSDKEKIVGLPGGGLCRAAWLAKRLTEAAKRLDLVDKRTW